jgi:hypothetical protein
MRHLVWLDAPAGALDALCAACPRLIANPAPARGLPAAADAARALDAPALAAVAHLGDEAAWLAPAAPPAPGGAAEGARAAAGRMPGVGGEASAGPPALSLAERFVAAYASRAAKLAAEHTRNVRRAERRRAAALGGAERAVRMAELGVPLTRLRR